MGLRIPRRAELLKFADRAQRPCWIFHGMKRSGNHAVLNWIQSGGRFFHINNPFWIELELSNPGYFRFPIPTGHVIVRKRWRKMRRMGFRPATYLLSVEDFPISTPLFDAQNGMTNILLVRDPENLFASRIKKAFLKHRVAYPRDMDATMQRAICIWLEHADELLATTEHLQNRIGIFFDRWVSDPEYRNLIAARIGISPVQTLNSLRAKQGEGSSFNGRGTVDASEAGDLRHRRHFLNERETALLDEVMAAPRIKERRLRLLAQFGMSAP